MTVDDDALRIATLQRYDILDTPPEASFDRITRLASTMMRVPIALISLVDGGRQWFKSNVGMAVAETSREISFCGHAIEGTTPFIVEDTTADPRFASNPLVVGDPHIRFYLGIPLRMQNGMNIGTLCAIDRVPRQASARHVSMMGDLARLAVDEIELRHLATTDSLTGTMTRRGLVQWTEAELQRCRRYGGRTGLIAIDLDHFKAINDRHGHAAGDAVLLAVADTCRSLLRAADIVGRVGGEEFVIFLPQTERDAALIVAERLRHGIASMLVPYGGELLHVTVSAGVTTLSGRDRTVEQALARADLALYEAKARGRNQVVASGVLNTRALQSAAD